MDFFTGCFTHAIDAKNRVSIPRKILDTLRSLQSADVVFVTVGLDRCLFLYTKQGFSEIGGQVDGSSMGEEGNRDFQRNFYSSAEKCSVDRNGRLLLPDTLKSLVGIEDRVVFAGVGRRVELWQPEEWESRQSKSREQYDTQAKDVFR
ncbi:MAG: division/cell wall cluster transcriptional repressor MraZ [Planctomycetota bacterium]|jgi:MraZ protein